MSKKIILITDDTAMNRKIIISILGTKDYRFIEAENGKQAVDISANQKIDLILLDCNMPIMDGFQACKIIKRRDEGFTPIIFITSNAHKEHTKKIIDAGADDIVRKPFNDNLLKNRVSNYSKLKNFYDYISNIDNKKKSSMDGAQADEKKSEIKTEVNRPKPSPKEEPKKIEQPIPVINKEDSKEMKKLKAAQEALDIMAQGFQVINKDGLVTYENNSAIKLLGAVKNSNINKFYNSGKFKMDKPQKFNFLDLNNGEEFQINTQFGDKILLTKLPTLNNKNQLSAILITKLGHNTKIQKANHKQLNHFLNIFKK